MRQKRTQILLSAVAVAAIAVAAATPGLLRGRVASALDALAGADQHWLAVAALCYLLGFAFTVASWRAALAAAGGRIGVWQASAGLAVGGMVNSFAPAKLGDAVKVALCSRGIRGPGRIWTAGGVYAALAAARAITLAGLVVAASATGALPLWPVFALVGIAAGLALLGLSSPRWRRHPRITSLLEGFASLERSPRAIATVLAWTTGMLLARLAATCAVAAAVGLPHPILAGLVIMPALDVSAAVPLTPGNVGIGSGAVAMVLASRGIGVSQALGTGIAIQAVETLVSIGTGIAAGAYLLQPMPGVRRWGARAIAVVGSAAAAAALGFYVVSLF